MTVVLSVADDSDLACTFRGTRKACSIAKAVNERVAHPVMTLKLTEVYLSRQAREGCRAIRVQFCRMECELISLKFRRRTSIPVLYLNFDERLLRS